MKGKKRRDSERLRERERRKLRPRAHNSGWKTTVKMPSWELSPLLIIVIICELFPPLFSLLTFFYFFSIFSMSLFRFVLISVVILFLFCYDAIFFLFSISISNICMRAGADFTLPPYFPLLYFDFLRTPRPPALVTRRAVTYDP